MVVVMILISAFACGFVYAMYGMDALMIALPPYVIAIVAAVLIRVIYKRKLNSAKMTSKEEGIKTAAYRAELKRLTVQQNAQQDAAALEIASLNSKSLALEKNKQDAEKNCERLSSEIDAFESIPDFYKEKEHLEKIESYLVNGFADSLQSALVLFEQYRRAELLSDLQRSEEEKKKAEEKEKIHKRVMLQLDYEDWKTDQKNNEAKSEIGYNIGKANDLVDEADSAIRARR